MITSKSLHRSNVAFVLDQRGLLLPENENFIGLYSGELSRGSRFIDDPVFQMKILSVPALKMTFTLEGARFRVDEDSEGGIQNSQVIREGGKAFHKLFPGRSIDGFGFNFDIYYRFSEVIPLDYLFGVFVDGKILEKSALRNLGLQFNLEKDGGKRSETYFLKIASPLELIVHANIHFSASKLLPEDRLQDIFEKSYNDIDEVIENLKF